MDRPACLAGGPPCQPTLSSVAGAARGASSASAAQALLPETLRTARLAVGLTQSELAGRLGYSQHWLSKVERGLRGLPRREAPRIVAALVAEYAERAAWNDSLAPLLAAFPLLPIVPTSTLPALPALPALPSLAALSGQAPVVLRVSYNRRGTALLRSIASPAARLC